MNPAAALLVYLASGFAQPSAPHGPSSTQTPPPSKEVSAPRPADSDRAPLDPSLLPRIEAWRQRVTSAKCIKIVEDAERHMHRDAITDSRGVIADPAHDSVTRVEGHSWMLPDALWLVIYPSRPASEGSKERAIDRTRPDVQLLWRHGDVFERVWDKELNAYRVRTYPCPSTAGPGDFDYGENCSLGDISESWLAPGSAIVKSITLQYTPEIRLTPPAPPAPGETWITLGIDQCSANATTGKVDYSRIDDVLFTQGGDVKEWHTRVVNNKNGEGNVTARRRYTFEFLDRPPEALLRAMDDFETLVAGQLPAAPAGSGLNPGAK